MLTKSDLSAIKKIIKAETNPIKTDIKGLKTDVKDLRTDVKDLKTDIKGLKTDVKGLKKGQIRLERKFDSLFNFLDKDHSMLKTEVKKIQSHLDLPVLEF